MILDPVLPLPLLVPLILLLAAAAGWLCRKACRSLPGKARFACILLYAAAVLAIGALLLNPGRYEKKLVSNMPVWLIASDTSASMASPSTPDAATPSRASLAAGLLKKLAAYQTPERDLRWFGIGHTASRKDDAAALADARPDADASMLASSIDQQLHSLQRQGRTVAGILLLSDGRDSRPDDARQLSIKAAGQNTPIHTVALGGNWEAPDIALSSSRTLVQAYKGTPITLTASVRNSGMGDRQLGIVLLDASGKQVERKIVDVANGKTADVAFSLESPENSSDYTIACEPVAGETRKDNNSAAVTVRAITSKIRVFMAEGSPYWDSKFLAQFLRKQEAFEVKSVHRFSQDRFYQINSGDDTSEPSPDAGIPTSTAEFLRYDIVILGKGMEHLFTPEIAEALQSYVRDHGGLLIFARGKSYGGSMPAMEPLEPFAWQHTVGGEHHLTPTPSGASEGLFGHVLPAPKDAVWKTLPGLEDVWDVDSISPDTRILATTDDGQTPLLTIRRVGMGAVACLNGEGLWKWDFYPEARRDGNIYADFWKQFLPWIQTAAEFRPGFDLSLHAERNPIETSDALRCTMSWRGIGTPGNVELQITPLSDQSSPQTVAARHEGEKNGLHRWTASLVPDKPGDYLLKAILPDQPEIPCPEIRIRVNPLPGELDNLNADREWLARLSESTGGTMLTPDSPAAAWDTVFAMPQDTQSEEEEYRPAWNRWWVLLSIGATLGLAWWIRRRHGLL